MMVRKARTSLQTRASNSEKQQRFQRAHALDVGPVADARKKRLKEMNCERQQRFRERHRTLERETIPEGDTGHEREPDQNRQWRHHANEIIDAMETDASGRPSEDFHGPRCSLSLIDDDLMDVVSGEDPIPSHTHFTRQRAQNERERDSTRQRVRRFRERHQAPLGDPLLLDDVVDDPVPLPPVLPLPPPLPPPPPYLPVHQQHAIHDFLDRLRVAGDDLHECSICLERYHGMPLHTSGTVCARCHNEVMCSYIHIVRFRAMLTT
jgi:hypothetical protein